MNTFYVLTEHGQKNTDFDLAGLCFTIIHKSQFCPIFFCFCAERQTERDCDLVNAVECYDTSGYSVCLGNFVVVQCVCIPCINCEMAFSLLVHPSHLFHP